MMEMLTAEASEALDFFVNYLRASDEKDRIARLILFGSVLDGQAEADSDIDVFVEVLDDPTAVSELCAEASLETMLKYGLRIEPIVGPTNRYFQPDSYFSRQVLKEGKAIYSMPEEEIRRGEARNLMLLAIEYLEQIRPNLELGSFRLVVDGAYNTAELCVKGLLRLRGKAIPRKHGAIVQTFSESYIKEGALPRDVGRLLNRGLELRNRARYQYHTEITQADAETMLALAEELVRILEDRLSEETTSKDS